MQGIYTIRSRITGATEFNGVAPIVTFGEFNNNALSNTLTLPPSYTARIVGYSYATIGAAHAVRLSLRSPLNIVPNLDDEVILRSEADVTTFATTCGPGGFVVPRVVGIFSQNQQPPVGGGTTGQSFQVFFQTTGKTDDATFMLWYRIAEEQQ